MKRKQLIWPAIIIIVVIGIAIYQVHENHVKAVKQAALASEENNCVQQQADPYLQQSASYGQKADQYPLLVLPNGSSYGQEATAYYDDYTSAVKQCQQEY